MTRRSSIRYAMRPGRQAACALRAPRRPAMSVIEQAVRLRAAWPSLTCTVHGRGRQARLRCHGPLRPSVVTRTYDVAVDYRLGHAPMVAITHPVLVPRHDQSEIPHTYAADDYGPLRPCLYYPPDGDWRDDRPLAWTIIPWLLEWLIEYEVWLVTGEWCGEGVPHRRAGVNSPDDGAAAVAPTMAGGA